MRQLLTRSALVPALLAGAAPALGAQSRPASAVGAATAAGATPGAITAAEIDGDLKFLSSDLLEGRAPATRGGRLAAEYIADQLRVAGVSPGVGDSVRGSYLQRVPIDVVKADPATIRVTASGKATATLRFPDDVVVWAGSATPTSAAKGEVVFVGYGAKAPEYSWDDFKGVDVRGKWLMVLVNDPPAPPNEPKLFGGPAMTYYGRWTYKYEEAERRGATGMLIVHTTERAGYPWQVVVGSNSVDHRLLPRDPNGPAPIGVRGWIKDTVAAGLLKQAGLDFDALRAQAARRDFRPVNTGIVLDASFSNAVSHLASENVVGVVRGRDPARRNEYVAMSAHWDHLGIGPKVGNDSIYNGAEDNASGVADLLAVARVAAAGPRPARSLLFVFVTAEESGLLGSAWFAEHPTVPATSLVADLNLDGGNLLGRVRDLNVLGDTKSQLGPMLARFAGPRGLRLSPDEHPEQGHFYRSDHFSFAKAGVPAVSVGAGVDYVGRPAGWGKAQDEEYTAKRYHQPSDEYRPDFDLAGAVQLSQLVLDFARSLANQPTWPAWNADAEFKRPAGARTTAAR